MTPVKLAIVGVGKIARDQHLPVIAGSPDFELVAATSRHGVVEGVPNYPDIESLLAGDHGVQAVSLCQPPQYRHHAARVALEAGLHVFLEKPPGATVSEVDDLAGLAQAHGVTLVASWHSRHAPAVEPARAWLAGKRLRAVRVVWKEDVRRWHPGQDWIWRAGGLGVFDPGINALSIASHILPAFFLSEARLSFPENRAAPIAATLSFVTGAGTPIEAVFDFRQTGEQTWDIAVETDAGELLLSDGGASLAIDGALQPTLPEGEYRALYDRFAELIREGGSDVDLRPLKHVADAFLRGDREIVERFDD